MDLTKVASIQFVNQSAAGQLMADLSELSNGKAFKSENPHPSSSSSQDVKNSSLTEVECLIHRSS